MNPSQGLSVKECQAIEVIKYYVKNDIHFDYRASKDSTSCDKQNNENSSRESVRK